MCRAIDNRAGGFMIAEVARLLKENKKNYLLDLHYQFGTGRGWASMAQNDHPDD